MKKTTAGASYTIPLKRRGFAVGGTEAFRWYRDEWNSWKARFDFLKGRDPGKLHPRRLTWNLRKHPWKRKIIFQTIIFRFYVNLWGCSCTPWKKSHGDQMEVDGSDDFPFLCSVSFRWTHANFLPSRDPLRLLHLLIKRVDVGRFHTRLVIWMSTFMWYLDMLQGSNKYTVYSRYSSI